jgi:hypothetical protein
MLTHNPGSKKSCEMENKVTKKDIAAPDEVRTFPEERLEFAKVGGIVFGKATLLPGWKWSESLKPIAGTQSCTAPTPGPTPREGSTW